MPIKMNPQSAAYEILETKNMIDDYPKVFEAAYHRFHKGKIAKKLLDELKKINFQCEDHRKAHFLPKDLLSKFQIILKD